MSKVLNESQIYPGWELPKPQIASEEKALLISSGYRKNFIIMFAKGGALIGLFISLYVIYNKYTETNDNLFIPELLTLFAFYIFLFGLAGFLAGIIAAKIYRK